MKEVPEVVKMGGKDHAEDVKLGEGLEIGAVHPAHTKGDMKPQGLTGGPDKRGYSMSSEETRGKFPKYMKATPGMEAPMDMKAQKAGLAWWTEESGDDIPVNPDCGARPKK